MTSDVAPLTLRTPYDVVGAVPHLLGFPPQESLVVICLTRRRVLLTLRFDLPAPAEEQRLADELAARASHAGASEVLLLCFTEHVDPMLTRGSRAALPHRRFVRRVGRAVKGRGLVHRESLLVADGRWWSYLCSVPACCPREGTPIVEPSSTLLALQAEQVGRGAALVASRADLARSIEPDQPLEPGCAGPASVGPASVGPASPGQARSTPGLPADHDHQTLLTLCRLGSDGGAVVSDTDRVRLGGAFRDIAFRDDVLAWIPRADGATLVDVLSALCRLTADPDAAPVCSVLAWAAYQHGNGALANLAVDRALRAEPDYSLANLLADMLRRQVPPSSLRSVFDGLQPHPLLATAEEFPAG